MVAQAQLKNQKKEVRAFARQRLRLGLDESQREELDQKLNHLLREFLKPFQFRVISGFSPLKEEPAVGPTILSENRFRWVFPKVDGQELKFYEPSAPDDLRPGEFLIREPNPETSRKVELSEIDAMLVPGLSFDRSGGRMGRGKGFYDRALEGWLGLRIGVCYSCQIFEDFLPRERFDVPVDVIVTERFVLWPSGDKGTQAQ